MRCFVLQVGHSMSIGLARHFPSTCRNWPSCCSCPITVAQTMEDGVFLLQACEDLRVHVLEEPPNLAQRHTWQEAFVTNRCSLTELKRSRHEKCGSHCLLKHSCVAAVWLECGL